MKSFKKITILSLLFTPLYFSLTACSEGSVGNDGDENTRTPQAALNLKTGISPLPIDLFFAGSTDGTINIPNSTGNPAITAVNQLDGWSTTANISVPFTAKVDQATLNGNTVLLIEVTTAEVSPGAKTIVPPPTQSNPTSPGMAPMPLQYGVDYFAEISAAGADGAVEQTVLIHPLKPLKPKSGYLVVLVSNLPTQAGTVGIATPEGTQMQSSGVFQLLKDNVDPSNPNDPTLRFYRLSSDADHTGDPNQDTTDLARANELPPADAETLEGIRRLYISIFGITDGSGLPRQSILQAWTISTQSTTDVMTAANGLSASEAKFAAVQPTGSSTLLTDIYAGVIDLPYYLEKANSQFDPTPLTTNWIANPANNDPSIDAPLGCVYLLTQQPKGASSSLTRCNPVPVRRSVERVPVLLTTPNSNSGFSQPGNGWPVVIFQHGITGNRTQMLAVADALAKQGLATIAIDQPLHGLTDNATGLMTASERTFNLDLVTQTLDSNGEAITVPGPDGQIDSSGTHYIQLASALTSRDNIRQSATDIIHLAKSIDGLIGADLDSDQIHFLGHSLGGIAGGTALGVNNDINAAVLAMSGGGIGKLLDGSGSFSKIVADGLAAQGINEGTETYESFLRLAQTAIDAGDPINFATAANAAHPVLIYQVTNDSTVPNNVVNNSLALIDGYLSGTEPLANTMQLPIISTDQFSSNELDGFHVFDFGTHISILTPLIGDDATTAQMQCEAAKYFQSSGMVIDAVDCPN